MGLLRATGAAMEGSQPDAADDKDMDAFLDKFQSQPYRGAFHKDRWEEEFDKIPLFMKKSPSEVDPKENPDLACLQSIIFDEERSPEERAKTYKDEGNDYFKEKDYKKAVISYTEGLKKKCVDPDLNAILYTNRAAAQYYLGNVRSALNDVMAARKLKPHHLKAIMRGALCHLELKHYAEAVSWCDEGLHIDAKEKKLLEVRAKADKLKRTEQRDTRKAKLKEKKEQDENAALLRAIEQQQAVEQQNPGSAVSRPTVCALSQNTHCLVARHSQPVFTAATRGGLAAVFPAGKVVPEK